MKRGISKNCLAKNCLAKNCLVSAALLLAAVLGGPSVNGQNETPKPPKPAGAVMTRPRVEPPVIAEPRLEAPQVVTIVHRLNGIALLRLLGRMSGDMNTVATLNESFFIGNEVHTNIIAGLALDDGHTIAAWLPRAKAELESPIGFPSVPMPASVPGTTVSAPAPPAMALPAFASHLTVFGSDGRERKARYVGFDGPTGISVLRVGELSVPAPKDETEGSVITGQGLRLFAPENVAQTRTTPPGRVYVRIGASEVTVKQITRGGTGKIERLTARGSSLSPAVIGGVAIDKAGVTVGIVQGITGNEALIISLETIRKAAKRVIARQSSVPRPFLGVRGEAIGFVPRAEFLLKGWGPEETNLLMQNRLGIMLTAVVPGTPAARARLRPGDVILTVNEKDVTSAQDFSTLIGQCEAATPVKFTVARPNRTAPEAITVQLTEAFNMAFQMEYQWPQAKVAQTPRPPQPESPETLANLGIETLAFAPKAAARLRAQSGRFVVWVDPESIAYRSGVREGDVIETVDTRTISRSGPGAGSISPTSKTIVLRIVRNGQRMHVTVLKDDLKKN